MLFQARLAHRDGDAEQAAPLVHQGLTELPGHRELHAFAGQIGALMPASAAEEARRFSL